MLSWSTSKCWADPHPNVELTNIQMKQEQREESVDDDEEDLLRRICSTFCMSRNLLRFMHGFEAVSEAVLKASFIASLLMTESPFGATGKNVWQSTNNAVAAGQEKRKSCIWWLRPKRKSFLQRSRFPLMMTHLCINYLINGDVLLGTETLAGPNGAITLAEIRLCKQGLKAFVVITIIIISLYLSAANCSW